MRKIDFSTLPEFLQYWQEDIAKLIRHQVVMIEAKGKPAVGATRMGGYPDIPTDREWATKWKRDGARSTFWDNNYMAQINLDDIPDSVRKPEWPTTGMVWIFFDHDDGEGECIYDPRPVKDIPLIAQDDRYTMRSCVVETLPWGTSELTDLFFKSDELITAFGGAVVGSMMSHGLTQTEAMTQVGLLVSGGVYDGASDVVQFAFPNAGLDSRLTPTIKIGSITNGNSSKSYGSLEIKNLDLQGTKIWLYAH